MKAAVATNPRLEPYVVVAADLTETYLVVDRNIVDRVSFNDVPFALMSTFFVFNICYPKGCNNLYTFLEVVILKYSSEKVPPSVRYLLAKLNAH